MGPLPWLPQGIPVSGCLESALLLEALVDGCAKFSVLGGVRGRFFSQTASTVV